MPTNLPRLNVVLEPATYQAISRIAEREGMSMSLAARDLLREALTIYEDSYWAKEAQAREQTLGRQRLLHHEEVWKS